MITAIFLLIVGFLVLIQGAKYLVSGATSLAYKLSIPPIVVGLTVVAFGTSMPEFVVNILASWKGNTDLSIGNILGSNISNILLILGITAIIYPLTTKKTTIFKEIPFSLLAAIIVFVLANDLLFKNGLNNMLTFGDGLVLLSFFIIFIYYIFGITNQNQEKPLEESEIYTENWKIGLSLLGGLIALIIGGKWIVENAISLATLVGLSEKVIGLTVVAIGTSLPELATSVAAVLKKQNDIAIGTVVGSNIFNIFWILGASALITPLVFDQNLNIDIGMTIFASLILFICMYIGKKQIIERWQGVGMVIIYFTYLGYLLA